MFVSLFLKSNRNFYTYENVNLVDLMYHKTPTGRLRKILSVTLDSGTVVNFCLSEISDLIVENHEDERHPFNDDAKIIFVEDGQAYEKR